jgi:hypothetical protein
LPKETRVAVLFQRFGPYHHARLNAAGKLMSVWGVEACAMEDTYAWNKVEGAAAFTRVTLTDRDSGDRRWKQELQRKLWRALDEIKPQASWFQAGRPPTLSTHFGGAGKRTPRRWSCPKAPPGMNGACFGRNGSKAGW